MPNRRAKEKRLKKDAGRARWGQFFRNGSGGGAGGGGGGGGAKEGGGRSSKIGDLKDDLVINFPGTIHHQLEKITLKLTWITY